MRQYGDGGFVGQLGGWRFGTNLFFPVQFGNETKAPPGKRLDNRLVFAGIADGAPYRVDAGGERRVGDDAAVPDMVDDLVLAHHPVAVFDQELEQRESLRLKRNRLRSNAENIAVGIQGEAFKMEDQRIPTLSSYKLR